MKTRVSSGISIASLIPLSLGIGAPLRVARWAQQAGYDFLQVLPTWGVTGNEKWPIPVKYHEGAWNPIIRSFPMGIIDALTHQTGGEGMPAGLKDLIGFPRASRCEIIERLLPGEKISHHLVPDGLYEVNPEDCKSAPEIADFCERTGCRLVLDTEHLLRDHRNSDWSPFGKTEAERLEAVRVLAPYVAVVHMKTTFHSPAEEIIRLLFASEHQERIDFVAEFKPELGPPGKVRAHMADFLEGMKTLVARYN